MIARHVRRSLLLLCSSPLAAALLPACGGDDAASTGVAAGNLYTGGSNSLSAFATEYVDASCARARRCDPAGATVGQAACDRARAEFESTSFPLLQAAVDAETVAFRPSDADVCVNLLKTATCEDSVLVDASCRAVFAGTLYPGSDCTLAAECSEGLYCDLETVCPGTCKERLGPGSACTSTLACPAPQTCFEGRCTAPALKGQSCVRGTRPCDPGLFCITDIPGGMEGVCRDRTEITVGKGEPCNPETGPFCQGELVCQFDGFELDMPKFGCVPRVGPTAACTYAFPDPCPEGTFCDETNFAGGDVDGRCRPLPTQGENCALSVLYPNRACAGDLVCRSGKGCQPPVHLGEGCAADDACASKRCVDGVCVPQDACTQL